MFDISKIKQEFEETIKILIKNSKKTPKLHIIQFGDDFASNKYIQYKIKKADQLGIEIIHHKFPLETKLNSAIELVEKINSKEEEGLIVQLPLPKHLESILEKINPKSDVDLLNPNNHSHLLPPTIRAIDLTLKSVILHEPINDYIVTADIDLSEQTIAVIGQGRLVGKPLSKYLSDRNARVINIDEFTNHPQKLSKKADIVITAVGKPNLVNADWIKSNTIVIDAGTSESSGKLVGDVDYQSLDESITIVRPPNGIGSLTILSLFYNLLLV